MKMHCLFAACLAMAATIVVAEERDAAPPTVTLRVTGLFGPERESDLREVLQQVPQLKLVALDVQQAEATFALIDSEQFSNATAEQTVERVDNLLRSASRATFGVRPRCPIPRDQLERIEIRVAGLDCKACSLAAYEAVARIEGVEQATASFKDGLVVAWIDATKTNRAALEEALKNKGVELPAS